MCHLKIQFIILGYGFYGPGFKIRQQIYLGMPALCILECATSS